MTYEKGSVEIKAQPIVTSLEGKDMFYLFPNVTSLWIEVDDTKMTPIHIDVEGFPYLKTITIHHPKSVSFKDCPSLESATMRNAGSEYNLKSIEGCPQLTVYKQ